MTSCQTCRVIRSILLLLTMLLVVVMTHLDEIQRWAAGS